MRYPKWDLGLIVYYLCVSCVQALTDIHKSLFLILSCTTQVWNRELSDSIIEAFNCGYRLVDFSCLSQWGGNRKSYTKKSDVPRGEIFIQTRVTNKQQYSHRVRESFFSSLEKLGLEYIDMYMIHWPVPETLIETWKEMERLYEEGYIRNLGVANCHQHHLERIISNCNIPPVLNQVEIHPLFTQKIDGRLLQITRHSSRSLFSNSAK